MIIACVGEFALCHPVIAQNIPTYFPSGTAGYDQQLGVTVLSRLRPLYEEPGIPIDSFVVRSSLDEALRYDSNVDGTPHSGSWASTTSGSLSVGSDWLRNGISAELGFTHNQYFSFPGQSYTDWHAGLGGGYTIADSSINIAYLHQDSHTLGTTIGSISSQTPTLGQADSAQINYTVNLGSLSVTPDISVAAYRFGTSTVLGQPVSEAFLDRDVIAAGFVGRYARSDANLLLVVRGVNSTYISPQSGQPSNNSNSVILLTGLDHQASAIWRYRLLVGVETRFFQSDQYDTRTAPVVEGSVIWSPTGLTTVTGIVSREIEDAQSGGTNGFIFSQGRLVVDHELLNNVLLQFRGRLQYAQYLQPKGGAQTSVGIGGGINWLLSHNVRISLDYDFTRQTGNNNASTLSNLTTVTSGSFTQHLAGLVFHFNL